VTENGGDGGDWSVVRSRKRKATQLEAGRRDNSRVSARQEGESFGLQVRQRGDSRVHNRSTKESSYNDQTDGAEVARPPAGGGAQANSTYTQRLVSDSKQQGNAHSTTGNKVSFYFTNIPECLPVFLLRQQFEVCGVLTDVYIAHQRNARGQVCGFVRFSHVKNADKLSNALNNVWFGLPMV